MVTALLLFGSIGLFVKGIPLPSAQLAVARGVVGTLVLLAAAGLRGRFSTAGLRRNLPLLVLSGAAMGVNWMLLFEAYRYTTVATATVCYYCAPLLVVLLSPLVLQERLTPLRLCCVLGAAVGVALVAGGFWGGKADARGVLCGLGAAAFYAAVMLLNKRITGVGGIQRTTVQLGAAALTLLPYAIATRPAAQPMLSVGAWALLAVVCVAHTGVAYLLYFSALPQLAGQSVAVLCYLDPLFAIALSALVLGERLAPWQWVGAALILGAALCSECLPLRRKGE